MREYQREVTKEEEKTVAGAVRERITRAVAEWS